MFPIAIAAGNAFVLKPSEQVPYTAVKLAELFHQAGVPKGILQVIHGSKLQVDYLLTHPNICAVSFVGSVPTAQYIYQTGTANHKRVQAFAGAKNHMVIMPDANKEQVIDQLVGSSVGAAGQRCMAISVAVFVGSSNEWIDELGDAMKAIRLVHGMMRQPLMGHSSVNKRNSVYWNLLRKGSQKERCAC
ncbi:methylmalonate-semialdehyde dehydrogenase [Vibrio maritimus]|uniref:methylmalonate-semialdehyde dehydrogenase (CoA acylating) n=1 Tax=Vibrio maritimus TaxID=990268 RepID=A0A090RPT5_9VIBR|nr:methylmalonate-semialdehyde dehydrogenase [Vibrio maritimus]